MQRSSKIPKGVIGHNGEIFKMFKVYIDDPCYKVLPIALHKHNPRGDPHKHELTVFFGETEMVLNEDDKPLRIFQMLNREGKSPVFQIRGKGTVKNNKLETALPGGMI